MYYFLALSCLLKKKANLDKLLNVIIMTSTAIITSLVQREIDIDLYSIASLVVRKKQCLYKAAHAEPMRLLLQLPVGITQSHRTYPRIIA